MVCFVPLGAVISFPCSLMFCRCPRGQVSLPVVFLLNPQPHSWRAQRRYSVHATDEKTDEVKSFHWPGPWQAVGPRVTKADWGHSRGPGMQKALGGVSGSFCDGCRALYCASGVFVWQSHVGESRKERRLLGTPWGRGSQVRAVRPGEGTCHGPGGAGWLEGSQTLLLCTVPLSAQKYPGDTSAVAVREGDRSLRRGGLEQQRGPGRPCSLEVAVAWAAGCWAVSRSPPQTQVLSVTLLGCGILHRLVTLLSASDFLV